MKSAIVASQPRGSIDALIFQLEHVHAKGTLIFLWRHRAHRNAPLRPYELLPLVGLSGRVLQSDISSSRGNYCGSGSKEGLDDSVVGCMHCRMNGLGSRNSISVSSKAAIGEMRVPVKASSGLCKYGRMSDSKVALNSVGAIGPGS